MLWAVGGVVAVVACLGVAWAWQVQGSANSGRTAVSTGIQSLRAGDAAGARTQFGQAQQDFQRSRDLLGPTWLQTIPGVGRQLQAVDQLAQIGGEGASAAGQLADLMAQATGPSGSSVNSAIKIAKPYLLSALDSFDRIAALEPQLSTDGLLPPIANAVTSLKEMLAPFEPVMARSQSLSTAVRYALDTDHRFLLVSQNNAELRATGGFMGSYGYVRLGPSGLQLEKYGNIYSLPWTSTANIPPPPGANMAKWKTLQLWDSNWWLDFPTSSNAILKIYDGLVPGQAKVDGVIAIDLITVKALLAQFGPIDLPQFGKTITADNMIPTLSRLINQDLYWSSKTVRKDILRVLSEKLLARVMNLTPSQLVPTATLLAQMANEKHLQVFTTDHTAQAALVDIGLSGAIDQPAGATDILAVNNTESWPGKINFGLHKSIDYRVQLDPSGSANTTLTLTYVKDKDRLLTIGRDWFGGYLRVYRPHGTTMTNWSSKRSMNPVVANQRKAEVPAKMAPGEVGTTAITAGFSLLIGETRTLTFNGVLPAAVAPGAPPILVGQPSAAPASTGDVLHYRLLIVRQADLEDNQTTVNVTAPPGWRIADAAAWQRSSGQSIDVTRTDASAGLSTPLSADSLFDITLVKA